MIQLTKICRKIYGNHIAVYCGCAQSILEWKVKESAVRKNGVLQEQQSCTKQCRDGTLLCVVILV